jgi:hypothetical protein
MLKKCGYGIEDPPCTVQPQLLCTTLLNPEGPISGLTYSEGMFKRPEVTTKRPSVSPCRSSTNTALDRNKGLAPHSTAGLPW